MLLTLFMFVIDDRLYFASMPVAGPFEYIETDVMH